MQAVRPACQNVGRFTLEPDLDIHPSLDFYTPLPHDLEPTRLHH
jgi:hypothetical protein